MEVNSVYVGMFLSKASRVIIIVAPLPWAQRASYFAVSTLEKLFVASENLTVSLPKSQSVVITPP